MSTPYNVYEKRIQFVICLIVSFVTQLEQRPKYGVK